MEKAILVANNENELRKLFKDIFEGRYNVLEARTGKDAVEMIKHHREELCAVVLDIGIANGGGPAVLNAVAKAHWLDNMPRIITSVRDDEADRALATGSGATDFIVLPGDKDDIDRRISQAIEEGKDTASEAKEDDGSPKSEAASEKDKDSYYKKLFEKMLEFIGCVSTIKNPDDVGHDLKVKGYTKILTDYLMENNPELKLTERKVDQIITASPLIDIGNLAIPDSVLFKPGRLSNEEYEFIKSHTYRGIEILDIVKIGWEADFDRTIRNMIKYHHERYDGSGYPEGLKGDAIPIEAQIVSVADIYYALTTDRVFRRAFSKEKAYTTIIDDNSSYFAPVLLVAFKACRDNFEAWADGDLHLDI